MVTTTIKKQGNVFIKEKLEDNGISKEITTLSASDLAEILISKGLLTLDDIK